MDISASYPLGDDRFSIDHGSFYFNFFQRLGDLVYLVVVHKTTKDVIAVAAGVIRHLPEKDGCYKKVWYICDLKVKQEYRGNWICLRMLVASFWRGLSETSCGYAITMNSGIDTENAKDTNLLVQLSKRVNLISVDLSTILLLWSLNYEEINNILPLLHMHRGRIAYYSLTGIKDIVLQSTNQPMSLYHVQFGPMGVFDQKDMGIFSHNPVEGAVHMFCCPSDDFLVEELFNLGLEPSASASVLSRGIDMDWKYVLTSDI
eukprot:TRINITY_DN8831_c0_g1_i1.p1 TRINITY_DN8831_c0_g1~~TRINITY_DN8831_c0_g1_i1.p1  ORF type:complete len:260 (+),score=30.75 TRINITY_DN8831_c0_g1_i1:769-1548(+)